MAQGNIKRAQEQQKKKYDRNAKDVNLNIGDRVMVYMPSEMQEKNWKLARPFHGPYRVIAKTPNNVEVCIIDDPTADSIFVSLDRVRLCYPEQGNKTWKGSKEKQKRHVITKRISKSDKSSHLHVGPTTRSMIHT